MTDCAWAESGATAVARVAASSARAADAVDLVMRGRSLLHAGPNREDVQTAVTLFEAALRIDPDNGQANVGLAQALIHVYRSRWDPQGAKVLQPGGDVDAVAVDPRVVVDDHWLEQMDLTYRERPVFSEGWPSREGQFMVDDLAAKLREQSGAETMLWGSGFPHAESEVARLPLPHVRERARAGSAQDHLGERRAAVRLPAEVAGRSGIVLDGFSR